MQLALEDRIRQRAYFLSLSGGGAGDETHFWLVAEREVLTEVATESAAASPETIQSVQAAKPTAVVQAIETACAGAIKHVSKHRQLFVSQRATVLQIARPKRCHLEHGGRSHAGHRAVCSATSA